MNNKTLWLRLILASILLTSLTSWGFFVHRTVAQLAIYQLPKKMRRFFYSNMDSLVQQSVRPDQRRNIDPAEAPRHFIDLENYGDSAAWKMPFLWEDALKIYGKDSLLKFGYLPYIIINTRKKLTDAFESKNADSILFYASYLGHYIGDAHVPLHVSANYDGQLSNQKGLHALWETIVPQQDLVNYDLYDRHRVHYITNPYDAVWQMIRQSQGLLKELFLEEKNIAPHFADSLKYRTQIRNGKSLRSYSLPFAKEYGAMQGPIIQQQLKATVESVSDFWYSSWVDAGSPDLDNLIKDGWSKKKKRALKQESLDYRHNKLVEKKKLISIKMQGAFEP